MEENRTPNTFLAVWRTIGRCFALLGIFVGAQVLCESVFLLLAVDFQPLFDMIMKEQAYSFTESTSVLNSFLVEHGQEIIPAMAYSMALAAILTSVILWFTRLAGKNTRPASSKSVAWGIMLVIPTAIIANVLLEYCDIEMPDEFSQTFAALQSHPVGILTICLLVPIAEEVTFRSGILGYLLKNFGQTRQGALKCVILSGFVFGLIHLNAAQSVGAGVLGCIMGWVYYRTGSVIPCIAMHALNNTASVVLGLTFPEESFIQLLGGEAGAIYLCIVCAVTLYLLLTKYPINDNCINHN